MSYSPKINYDSIDLNSNLFDNLNPNDIDPELFSVFLKASAGDDSQFNSNIYSNNFNTNNEYIVNSGLTFNFNNSNNNESLSSSLLPVKMEEISSGSEDTNDSRNNMHMPDFLVKNPQAASVYMDAKKQRSRVNADSYISPLFTAQNPLGMHLDFDKLHF